MTLTPDQVAVDAADATPPYEQVRRRLEELIETGALPVGARLPAVRRLAGDLGLAAGTVARAYRELEQAGLIETRRGAGTRVAGSEQRRTGLLREQAAAYVEKARLLGFADDEISAAVARELHA
ncbi:GntR family transcriptional regulator [Nocardioides sp. DS6]|uniref:GntR family transcriptional regulator n=1 Tax=Nocardioides eburneus TaxID=3231482 RepID=A0ABV3T6Y6_9ACTN